jgi:hypothetical protein
MTWVPALRGYPDAGGALLVALAAWLYLHDTQLRRPWQPPAIGILLAAAIVFRRHFLFAAPALLGAMAVCCAVQGAAGLRRRPRELRPLIAALARVPLTAIIAALALFVIGRPFASRTLAVDFYELYRAYLTPRVEVLHWYVEPYGWIAPFYAIAGFVLGIASGSLARPVAVFVLCWGGLSLLEWTLIVRQVGEQYTLHFTPAVVLGLLALGWSLYLSSGGAFRTLVPRAAEVYVVANLLSGTSTLQLASAPAPLAELLAANWRPLKRWDHAEVHSLVERLRVLAPNGEPVFVAASSHLLNPDLVRNAERARFGWRNAKLNVLESPAVDSRDQYPLETLLKAGHVVLADPFQHHLPLHEQRVAQVVFEMFREGRAMARDFAPLEDRFLLADARGGGRATVTLHRRRHPSSLETGIETLRFVQGFVGRRPGAQPDWAVVGQIQESWAWRRMDGATALVMHPAWRHEGPRAVALYIGTLGRSPLVEGSLRFVDGRCAGAELTFSLRRPGGEVVSAGSVYRRPQEEPAFSVPLERADPSELFLHLTNREGESIDYCLLEIDPLVVR